MKTCLIKKSMLIVAAVAVLTVSAGVFAADYLSPISVVASGDGKVLYVAEATANQIAVYNIGSGKVTNLISVAENPVGLAISADSSKLYVTSAAVSGKVQVVDVAAGKVGIGVPNGG